MWYTRDAEFRYLWKRMSGDVSLAADISFPDSKGFEDRKAVLIVRQSLDDDSKEAIVALHGAGMIHLARRPEKGLRVKDMEYRIGGRGMPAGASSGQSGPGDRPPRSASKNTVTHFLFLVSLEGEPMHAFGPPISLHLEEPFYAGIGFLFASARHPWIARCSSDVVLENAAGKVR